MARNYPLETTLALHDCDGIEGMIPYLFWLEAWSEDYDPKEGTAGYYCDEFGHRRPFNVDDDSLPPFVELPNGTKVFHSVEEDAVIEWLYTRVTEEIHGMYDAWYEYWDEKPVDKCISEYWNKWRDDLIENASKFLEQEDAKVGIIYDPDYFTRKQNAA